MTQPLKQPYPGLPENWFPLKPVTCYWTLDAQENIDICRHGYPLVPDFSMTRDSATGQNLKAGIPDLGDFGSPASKYGAMRGYIALSRVLR